MVWNIDQNAFNHPPAFQQNGASASTQALQGLSRRDFALQNAEQNLQLGQALAVSLSLSPMGAVHFGPALARYNAWVMAQRGLKASPASEPAPVGLAEVPTDSAPSK